MNLTRSHVRQAFEVRIVIRQSEVITHVLLIRQGLPGQVQRGADGAAVPGLLFFGVDGGA